jgi:hypothetical protein
LAVPPADVSAPERRSRPASGACRSPHFVCAEVLAVGLQKIASV